MRIKDLEFEKEYSIEFLTTNINIRELKNAILDGLIYKKSVGVWVKC